MENMENMEYCEYDICWCKLEEVYGKENAKKIVINHVIKKIDNDEHFILLTTNTKPFKDIRVDG